MNLTQKICKLFTDFVLFVLSFCYNYNRSDVMAIINVNKTNRNIDMDLKTINNIKALGIDMINTASSGHPGIVLGAAPILYELYSNHLVFDRENPNYINRDRFVMSAGHGAALLYATLFMSGFPISLDDLKKFRQYGSKTPGHPEVFTTPGVDVSTGPLGQGLATAVGMAIGEAYLNQKFRSGKNSLIDHYTYVLCSDGDMMEGISYEAGAIAGNLGLGKLIVLYDSNNMSLDKDTKNTLSENVLDRFKALNWDTHLVADAYDLDLLDDAITRAKAVSDKPSIIEIKTVLGKDSKYQNTNAVHGRPLEREDIKRIKKKLKIRDVEYTVLSDAYDYMKKTIDDRVKSELGKWEKTKGKLLSKFSKDLVRDFDKIVNGDLIIDLKKSIFKFDTNKSYSGRDLSSHIINKLNKYDVMCLTTDTGSSTRAYFNKEKDFIAKNYSGKNVSCGVRELAGSAILNGLLLMNIRGIISTFLAFSNYMIPSIRMACLMNLAPIYLFTHDSVLIGEDGPSHQPIEQIEMLRSIINLVVFRPCDRNEMIGAYKWAFSSKSPVAIVASKDVLLSMENTDINKVSAGGYLLKSSDNDDICIIASGSEVAVALEVSSILEKHMLGVRVVSVPSIELLENQKKEDLETLLPKDMKKVVIELSSCQSYYKFLNSDDLVFNVNSYLKSGKKEYIIKNLKFDALNITEVILESFKQRK